MDADQEQELRDRFCDELQFAWTLGIEMAEASQSAYALSCALRRSAGIGIGTPMLGGEYGNKLSMP
jgi:hypothetical protein